MAEEIAEEIVILEEDVPTQNISLSEEASEEDAELEAKNKKKKIIIISLVAVIVLLIIGGAVAFFMLKKSSHHAAIGMEAEAVAKAQEEVIEPSKLESMIAKADYLYSNGSKEQALVLYKQIAQYSEAISAYNLGVSLLKDEQYKNALEAFEKAIQNNEKRCVSAINAAVCALHLKDETRFNYFLDLAYAYLPQERSSRLYSYYFTLINYYRGNYFEALSALSNPTADDYAKTRDMLSAKIYALLGANREAVDGLKKNYSSADNFTLGILYARNGDLNSATKYLNQAQLDGVEPARSKIALGLIDLKNGYVGGASKSIGEATAKYPNEVYKHYPIKVYLKDSLFDANEAQRRYRKVIIKSKFSDYQKIFYFSPYKIYNANQTIDYIKKGNASIAADNMSEAQDYLSKGTAASSINLGIVASINKALAFKLRESNEMLLSLVAKQPNHSVLHYNLALTYAQLGDMVNANKHFTRSYNLDAKNYISGIYAVMTSQLINKDSKKLFSIIKEVIASEKPSEHIELCKTLMALSEGNLVGTADWLHHNYKTNPLYLTLSTIVAMKQNNMDLAKKHTKELTAMLPDEIIAHLMYIDAHYWELKPKEYARESLAYLRQHPFSFRDLYFGAYITRYLYIQQALMTGQLYYLRKQLQEALVSTQNDTRELTAALALASLYDRAFEDSFVLYNDLIDNKKVTDAQTLMLGAVASTAANQHQNAIALLELCKLKTPNDIDSKYALGLLYLEAKNNHGAIAQLSKITVNHFDSDYFTFDIDVKDILDERENTSAPAEANVTSQKPQ